MTSKERVLCTIEGGIPDRIPMNFGANRATLQKLFHYFKTKDHMELLNKLNIDIFDMRGVVDPVYIGPVPNGVENENGIRQNFWGIRSKLMQTATGPEECFCDFILKGTDTIEELEKYPWPKADWFDFKNLKDDLKPLSSFAIMAAHGSFFQMPTFLKGLDDFLADILINTEIAVYIMDRFTEFYLDFYERIFVNAPGMINIIRLAEDIGMQDRPLVDMTVFDTHIAPRIRKFVDLAHSYGVKLMFHSCGSVEVFVERLIKLGVDILDPIQVRAYGMEPEDIKRKYGSRICLHGSVDTQYTLPRGTIMDVEEEVRERIRVLGKGGGFILAPCHVLQTDVPEANAAAMYKTGYMHGFYNNNQQIKND